MATTEAAMVINMFVSRQNKSSAAAVEQPPKEFDAVYRSFIKPVYAFVAYRVRERAEAEDITSQVFERAWRGYETYDSAKAPVSTWLFTIARNCVTDHLRRAGRAPGKTELNDYLRSDYLRSSDFDEPEPRLQALELRQELRQAISGLDEREREVVALKFGGAMTNRDIATLLKIPESNAGTILYRSLKKMKTRLEGAIDND